MSDYDTNVLHKRYFDSTTCCPSAFDWFKINGKLGDEYAKICALTLANTHCRDYWFDIGLPCPDILRRWDSISHRYKKELWAKTMVWATTHNLMWVIEQSDFIEQSLTDEAIAEDDEWRKELQAEQDLKKARRKVNAILQHDKTWEAVVNEIRAKEEWEFLSR